MTRSLIFISGIIILMHFCGCSMLITGRRMPLHEKDIQEGVKVKEIIAHSPDYWESDYSTFYIPGYAKLDYQKSKQFTIKKNRIGISSGRVVRLNILMKEGYLPETVVFLSDKRNPAFLVDFMLAGLGIPISLLAFRMDDGEPGKNLFIGLGTGLLFGNGYSFLYSGNRGALKALPEISHNFIKIPNVSEFPYKLNLTSLNSEIDLGRVPGLIYGKLNNVRKMKVNTVYVKDYSSESLRENIYNHLDSLKVRADSTGSNNIDFSITLNSLKNNTLGIIGNAVERPKGLLVTNCTGNFTVVFYNKHTQKSCLELTIEVNSGFTKHNEDSERRNLLFNRMIYRLMGEESVQYLLEHGVELKESGDEQIYEVPQVEAIALEDVIKSSVSVLTPTGHGSGFLIDGSGLFLTNAHVVGVDSLVRLITSDNELLEAKVVRVDHSFDVALLKIDQQIALKPVSIALNELPQQGKTVWAIGSPLHVSLGQTLTKGVFSSKRLVKDRAWLQFDAKVNEGSSGGALLNENNEVIGIVTAKIKGAGIEGVGFAIPITEALEVLKVKIIDTENR